MSVNTNVVRFDDLGSNGTARPPSKARAAKSRPAGAEPTTAEESRQAAAAPAQRVVFHEPAPGRPSSRTGGRDAPGRPPKGPLLAGKKRLVRSAQALAATRSWRGE